MESKKETRLRIARRFIDHFAKLEIDILHTILADEYHHQFAPASLDPPGPFDKQGLLDHHIALREVMVGFPVTAKEYIDSESESCVTVWATSRVQFRDDVKGPDDSEADWAYEGEYIFLISFDATGERIVRTVEFLDSKQTADRLVGLMERARENTGRLS
ncbi:hypothetical protein ASPZODRAFT_128949 [Penicilliopsis zonata CBS 506.65]|uniref:SnoaL-like domain-containing protein n=1 Tax=Penicilliopsis zonata CBS 506.65 TaxID=1073090 RepID=A0A1L9SSZ8_9EURO|nr:hypothetical protein ASPZODRAFT_128949 [Penicilliopsis zonata CBS 506.65]OJJ50332.1 hypothetical protein ASPZODRAFT_128949 [Penicilliopsis zonata CBS 506.65]